MTRLTRGLLTFLLILGVGLGATAQSANEPAVDRSAPIKTMVPHRNAVAFQSSPAAASKQTRTIRGSFSGPPYKVGPTKTLTTTVPEAEEHIAVDPNNFKNLIGMISDFSLTEDSTPASSLFPRTMVRPGRKASCLSPAGLLPPAMDTF